MDGLDLRPALRVLGKDQQTHELPVHPARQGGHFLRQRRQKPGAVFRHGAAVQGLLRNESPKGTAKGHRHDLAQGGAVLRNCISD